MENQVTRRAIPRLIPGRAGLLFDLAMVVVGVLVFTGWIRSSWPQYGFSPSLNVSFVAGSVVSAILIEAVIPRIGSIISAALIGAAAMVLGLGGGDVFEALLLVLMIGVAFENYRCARPGAV